MDINQIHVVEIELNKCAELLKCNKTEVVQGLNKVLARRQELQEQIGDIRQRLISLGIDPDD